MLLICRSLHAVIIGYQQVTLPLLIYDTNDITKDNLSTWKFKNKSSFLFFWFLFSHKHLPYCTFFFFFLRVPLFILLHISFYSCQSLFFFTCVSFFLYVIRLFSLCGSSFFFVCVFLFLPEPVFPLFFHAFFGFLLRFFIPLSLFSHFPAPFSVFFPLDDLLAAAFAAVCYPFFRWYLPVLSPRHTFIHLLSWFPPLYLYIFKYKYITINN